MTYYKIPEAMGKSENYNQFEANSRCMLNLFCTINMEQFIIPANIVQRLENANIKN